MEPGVMEHATMWLPILWGTVGLFGAACLAMVVWGIRWFHHRLCVLECAMRGLGLAFYEFCVNTNAAWQLGLDCKQIKEYIEGKVDDA